MDTIEQLNHELRLARSIVGSEHEHVIPSAVYAGASVMERMTDYVVTRGMLATLLITIVAAVHSMGGK